MDIIQSALENKIKRYQRAYYAGKPLVSDEEFDRLWDELLAKYPESKLLKQVGSDLTKDSGKKEKHYMIMGSQDKFNNPEDLHKWLVNESIKFPVIVEHKMDGISCELQYLDGKLICALTRGDGYEGENITSAVALINGVPNYGVGNEDGTRFTGAVRGEILITRRLFEGKYGTEFKNPRNFVAGAVKNEKFRNFTDLEFVSYDVYSKHNNYWVSAIEARKLEFLKHNGFHPVWNKACRTEQEILDIWNSSNPKSSEFDIDGLVIKQNQVDFNDYKELRPKKQHAFKWPDEGKETVLVDIEWSRSGTTFTPVAILEPVDIEGSTVSRASLANPSLIKDLGLRIGDTVLVTKRGMIIPKIEKVVKHSEAGKEIEIPTVCPVCGAELSLKEKSLSCPNPQCKGNQEHRIAKWLNVLDVKGFGSVMQKDLAVWDIHTIPDLYDDGKTVRMMEEYGSINCRKAFNDLDSKSSITLEQLIAGFDIPGIGIELVGELVKAGYNTVDKILGLTLEQIVPVNNWSTSRAADFLSGLNDVASDIRTLVDKGFVTIVEPTTQKTSEGALSGLHVCVTGKLEHFTRKQIEDFLKQNGAIADGGVTGKTDILVTNDQSSGSSKLKNAQKYGTKIISEKELMEMV